jgi:hypothetical protein
MKLLAIRVIVASLTLATWTAGVTQASPIKRTSVMTVRIDVMPGVADKVIDTALAERIPVVVFGEAALDAREIDATSLSLNGGAVTKREDGSLASYRDVDGDGRVDLLIDIASSMMHLGDSGGATVGRAAESGRGEAPTGADRDRRPPRRPGQPDRARQSRHGRRRHREHAGARRDHDRSGHG